MATSPGRIGRGDAGLAVADGAPPATSAAISAAVAAAHASTSSPAPAREPVVDEATAASSGKTSSSPKTNASVAPAPCRDRADVVHEGQQRRHRAEAARDRAPDVAAGRKLGNRPARLAQHGDIGVAEP
jgi:hypothetical protein